MPQTTAEKKFFPTEADKIFSKRSFVTSKSPTIAEFQEYKGSLKNVAGGEG